MKLKWPKYVVFGLIFIGVTLWMQLWLMVVNTIVGSGSYTSIENGLLEDTLIEKSGISISGIKMADTDRAFGAMIGLPSKPQMILSRGLLERFSSTEIEYVVLHEAGHYYLSHTIKEAVVGLVFLAFGILLLKRIRENRGGIATTILMGAFFGIVMIQLGRKHEVEADRYALEQISDPHGMYSASEKFRSEYVNSKNDNQLLRLLFYRGNSYDSRLRMANDEISKRSE